MKGEKRVYTAEELDKIESFIREGRGMAPALRELGIPTRTFQQAMARVPELRLRIEAAQHEAAYEVIQSGDAAAADGRPTSWHQWKAARLCPEMWGDPAKRLELTGAQGGPVQSTIKITLAEAEALAAGEDDDGDDEG